MLCKETGSRGTLYANTTNDLFGARCRTGSCWYWWAETTTLPPPLVKQYRQRLFRIRKVKPPQLAWGGLPAPVLLQWGQVFVQPHCISALLAEQAYMEKSMRRYSQERFAVELSALSLKLPCQLAKATKLWTGQSIVEICARVSGFVHGFL